MKRKRTAWLTVLMVLHLCGAFQVTLTGAEEVERQFVFSVGYGVPYGNLGVNLEVNPLLPKRMNRINHFFGFSLGLGYKIDAPLLDMGVNVYPIGNDGLLVPRISFHYSKVDRILDPDNIWEEDYDSVEALSAGGGLGLKLTDWLSVQGDAFYLFHIYDGIAPDLIGGRFRFSLGARIHCKTAYENQLSLASAEETSSFLQLGLGMGIPYGGIGLNLEFSPLLPGTVGQNLHNYSSFLIGSGFSPAGSAYSIGLRFYPMGKERSYRPRIGIHYGTVAQVEWWGGDSSNLEGLAFSGGLLYKINSKWAVDGDLMVIASVFGWELDDLDSVIKLSFGVRYLF